MIFYLYLWLQKVIPLVNAVVRQLTDASTDLKQILAAKIPAEQERIKNFRKQHGGTKVGEVTVDMVNPLLILSYLLQ